MVEFKREMRKRAIEHKTKALGIVEQGKWRGRSYAHILPEAQWTLNIWEGIREKVQAYFDSEGIAWHDQRHNLLSSQILCVNLFFPLRDHLELLEDPFRSWVPDLACIEALGFEYDGPPGTDYFGERGTRGQNRTSADVALMWTTACGKHGVFLLEFKYTEEAFGSCGGAVSRGNKGKERCNRSDEVIASPETMCYLAEKKHRTYWDLALADDSPLRYDRLTAATFCPFRYDFYQLMRNQLLAYAIERDSDASLAQALFGVVYHGDNARLRRMGYPFDGEHEPFAAWCSLLKEPQSFQVMTIQDILATITPRLPPNMHPWRDYLSERYGL